MFAANPEKLRHKRDRVKTKQQPPKPAPKAPVPEDDPEVTGLLTEIEDDMREEELRKLWARYGNIFVTLLIVAVLGVLGWQFWRQKVDSERQETARSYEQALDLMVQGKSDEALTAYAGVAGKRGEGFATLAQLQKASILAAKGDTDGTLAAYKALSEDGTADPLFRDLATVLYVMHAFDREEPAKLEAALQPIMSTSNAYYHSGVELAALLAHKRGDSTRATSLAEQLIADSETPGSIRSRAEELLVMFKTGTVAPTIAAPASVVVPTPVAPASPEPMAPAAPATEQKAP
jgi:hypothetical protein